MLKSQFKKVDILQISRGNNSHADSLATLASLVANPFSRIVSVELLPFSSVIPLGKDLNLKHTAIHKLDRSNATYLQNRTLPVDRKEA